MKPSQKKTLAKVAAIGAARKSAAQSARSKALKQDRKRG